MAEVPTTLVSCVTSSGVISIDLDQVSFIEVKPHKDDENDYVFVRIQFGTETTWTLEMDVDEALHLMQIYADEEEYLRVIDYMVKWRMGLI